MVDDGESGVHRLVVKGVSKDDGDEYMVKATNTQGSKLCRSQLLVQSWLVELVFRGLQRKFVSEKCYGNG